MSNGSVSKRLIPNDTEGPSLYIILIRGVKNIFTRVTIPGAQISLIYRRFLAIIRKNFQRGDAAKVQAHGDRPIAEG
jgi:hypothetical protein